MANGFNWNNLAISVLVAAMPLLAKRWLDEIKAPPWLWLVAVLASAGAVAVLMLVPGTRWRWISLGAVVVVYIAIAAYGLLASPPRFRASFHLVQPLTSPEFDAASWWQADNVDAKDGCYKSLVDEIIGVTVENMQAHGTQIIDIKMEAQIAGGDWVPLKILRHGKTYVVRPKDTIEIEPMRPPLDRTLRDTVLRPREPVRGVLLLQYPRPGQGAMFKPNTYRLTLTDADGSETVELSFVGGAFLETSFKVLAAPDISKCKIEGPDKRLKLLK